MHEQVLPAVAQGEGQIALRQQITQIGGCLNPNRQNREGGDVLADVNVQSSFGSFVLVAKKCAGVIESWSVH